MKICITRGCNSMAINVDPNGKFCDVCYYRRPLISLLAIVHRDDGEYTSKIGIEKSTSEAILKVGNMITVCEAFGRKPGE